MKDKGKWFSSRTPENVLKHLYGYVEISLPKKGEESEER